jgi:predicted ATPase
MKDSGIIGTTSRSRVLPCSGNKIRSVVAQKILPDALVGQIVAKTDGMPLFIEELTKVIIESGSFAASGNLHDDTWGSGELMIPVTLQDSLLARIDRLTESKVVAQIGAAIGREFSFELLAAVLPSKPKELEAALAILEAADLISARGIAPQVTYTFKHALVQEAAYLTLLISRRQTLHKRIAETLQSNFAQIAEVQPELLAHHFNEAGLTAQAIDWWERAALRSAARSPACSNLVRTSEKRGNCSASCGAGPAELRCAAISRAPMSMSGVFSNWRARPGTRHRWRRESGSAP